MIRSRWFAPVLAAFALYVLPGCSGEKPAPPSDEAIPLKGAGTKGTGGGPVAVASLPALKEPLKSTIKGKVVLDGEAPMMPEMPELKLSQDKACCWDSAPESQKIKQTWHVKNGAVENVIVYLEPPKGKSFAEKKFTGNIVIDQPFCQYVPHVAVIRPGETLTYKNSAVVNHNVLFEGNKNSGNIAQTAKIGVTELKLNPEKSPISVSCSSHKWMSGWIWPTSNPYVVRTNEKGEFEIPDVPTGVELEVKYWHEAKKNQTVGKITTKDGDNTVDIKIKP